MNVSVSGIERNHVYEIEADTSESWNVYQYQYMYSFVDKVYASKINDTDLVEHVLEQPNYHSPDNYLAGDIREEFILDLDSNYTEKLNLEISLHLSRIAGKPIKRVNFKNDGDNTGFWVNKQSPTEYNPLHSHTGIFSFVYYAAIPEEIRNEHELQRGNSATRGLIQFVSTLTNQMLTFNPRVGDILIFESTHLHQVYPFYRDCVRVSVAGNVYGVEFEDGEIVGDMS